MTIWSQQMKVSVQTTCHLSRIDPSPWSDPGPLTTVLLEHDRRDFFFKKSLAKGCGVIPTVQPNYTNHIFTIMFVYTFFFCIVLLFWNLFYFNTFYILIKKIIGIKTNRIDFHKIKIIAFMIKIYLLKFWST